MFGRQFLDLGDAVESVVVARIAFNGQFPVFVPIAQGLHGNPDDISGRFDGDESFFHLVLT